MKILVVAIPSIHTLRWLGQLDESGHDIYFFNILEREFPEATGKITVIDNWKKNSLGVFAKLLPKRVLKRFEAPFETSFHEVIQRVKPDVVHSFNLNTNYPILPYMEEHPALPWICSTWGSDLYHYKNIEKTKKIIQRIMQRLNYLITDNKRDHIIAKEHGFSGDFIGVFPGGGGFVIPEIVKSLKERSAIIVKGYEHNFGRGLNCLKAIKNLHALTKNHKIIVFGAHPSVVEYAEMMTTQGFKMEVYPKNQHVPHSKVLSLMEESLVYVGSSISDGMPNTLLEAIVMGAFPIQSNPGGVTEEVISHGINGYLIMDPESVSEISKHIEAALTSFNLLEDAFDYNRNRLSPTLEYELIKEAVLNKYTYIEKQIANTSS